MVTIPQISITLTAPAPDRLQAAARISAAQAEYEAAEQIVNFWLTQEEAATSMKRMAYCHEQVTESNTCATKALCDLRAVQAEWGNY